MFDYKTLENTKIEILHEAFLSAFSDYQVKMDLPFWKFQQMLQRRGYVSEISIGAFKNNMLVGFVLNGFRNWSGKLTVYDTGTGVLGEYRKQGITSNMLLNIKEVLKEKEVEQYLLEVIQTNTSAVQLYKKQGFEIIRNLACFQLDKNKYIPMATYKVEHIGKFDSTNWKHLMEFWDFKPSWQNSIDSINAASDTFIYSIVRFDDIIVGYGIIDKKTGDIPQIAVNKNYRRKGIARSIVTDLLKNTESHKVGVLNVEHQSKSTKDFLLVLGFEHIVDQYEMVLKL
ncbi:GNAT family N-acetyltransferase [Clostridium algidicarnis]|uniref:GNAT family N-acetyltransferase n=1 Tax=Clostridium algidicarnis TaxID=37659 RepID=UPI001C0CEA38|nr:GNAT family N-acetyltransferase [Clostridium algidicarnis]MBU3195199.1 GNAT family N-acetyltransferase [Clostridium algidicarnis]MBU3227614.1 GNAT family N-acetyltransferase [Clostridium algidicarnis]MBU3250979.1 GNAT family N-acetyltransferase [Clostridium algidicarnis]